MFNFRKPISHDIDLPLDGLDVAQPRAVYPATDGAALSAGPSPSANHPSERDTMVRSLLDIVMTGMVEHIKFSDAQVDRLKQALMRIEMVATEDEIDPARRCRVLADRAREALAAEVAAETAYQTERTPEAKKDRP